MEKAILNAVDEYTGTHYDSLVEALKDHTRRELLDIYLRYEGIIGYTDSILSVLIALGFDMEIEDDDFFEREE